MRMSVVNLAFGAILIGGGCGKPSAIKSSLNEAWIEQGAPHRLLDEPFADKLASLPQSGRTITTPWSDSYWPNHKRGLAWRWQLDDEIAQTPSKEEVQSMSAEELQRLSPAEKYDIFTGQYDYPLTSSELQRTSPDQETWWGLCHGWAPASYGFAEPQAITVQNPDGISIDFTASDLKALLIYAQQYNRTPESTRFMALRCEDETVDSARPYKRSCRDVNPGAFHIVLATMVGQLKQGLVADFSADAEVWNFPILGFASEILSESDQVYAAAAPGTVKIVEVETRVDFVKSISPQAKAIGSADLGQFSATTYRYVLELDENGRIIGGEWRSEEHPDFLWTQTPFAFEGAFAALGSLYKQATAEPPTD